MPTLKLTLLIQLTLAFLMAKAWSAPMSDRRFAPVYLEPNSPLSTDSKPLKELNANIQEIISKTWDYVEVKGQQGWVRRSLVLTPWHFETQALLKTDTAVYQLPKWNLTPKSTITTSTRVDLLEVDEDWARVRHGQGRSRWQGWVPLEELKPIVNSWGQLYTVHSQSLLANPHIESRLPLEIPIGTILSIQGMVNGFAQVQYANKKGFVPLESVLSKLHFAKEVQDLHGTWHKVLFLMGDLIQTADRKYITAAQIRALRVYENRLYVNNLQASLRKQPSLSSSRVDTLTRWQPLNRYKHTTVRWARHKDRRGNSTWWILSGDNSLDKVPTPSDSFSVKQPSQILQKSVRREIKGSATASVASPMRSVSTAQVSSPEKISSETLFRRKVFDIAASPLIPNLTFASANGIFRSLDGKNWEQIPDFANHNYPIAVAPNGTVYVGPYRSTDHGITFSNFIRWDKLIAAIQSKTRTTSTELRLLRIEIPSENSNHLKLTLHTGASEVQVMTPNGGGSWHQATK